MHAELGLDRGISGLEGPHLALVACAHEAEAPTSISMPGPSRSSASAGPSVSSGSVDSLPPGAHRSGGPSITEAMIYGGGESGGDFWSQ